MPSHVAKNLRTNLKINKEKIKVILRIIVCNIYYYCFY